MAYGTSNVSNQAIAHLSYQAGGRPFCGSKRAHISVAVADAHKWGRICTRCAKRLEKINAPRKARLPVHVQDNLGALAAEGADS